jgi:hypothetical protein
MRLKKLYFFQIFKEANNSDIETPNPTVYFQCDLHLNLP